MLSPVAGCFYSALVDDGDVAVAASAVLVVVATSSCNFNVLYPRPCHSGSRITRCLFYFGFPFFYSFFVALGNCLAAAVLQLLVRKLHFSAFYISMPPLSEMYLY